MCAIPRIRSIRGRGGGAGFQARIRGIHESQDLLESAESRRIPVDALRISGAAGSALEATLGRVALFSLHLDATDEAQRVKALGRCLELSRGCGCRHAVLLGDFNTECLPGSCVGAFLADSVPPTAEDMAREMASAMRLGGGEEVWVMDWVRALCRDSSGREFGRRFGLGDAGLTVPSCGRRPGRSVRQTTPRWVAMGRPADSSS